MLKAISQALLGFVVLLLVGLNQPPPTLQLRLAAAMLLVAACCSTQDNHAVANSPSAGRKGATLRAERRGSRGQHGPRKEGVVLDRPPQEIPCRVRVQSRSISPRWGVSSISFGSPHVRCMGRTCGGQTKSRKMPTQNIFPLFFAIRWSHQRAETYKSTAEKLWQKCATLGANTSPAERALLRCFIDAAVSLLYAGGDIDPDVVAG